MFHVQVTFPVRLISQCNVDSSSCVVKQNCHKEEILDAILNDKSVREVAYTWENLQNLTKEYFAYSGRIYDLDRYLNVDSGFLGEPFNTFFKSVARKDATFAIRKNETILNVMRCFEEFYWIGMLDSTDTGCAVSRLVIFLSMAIVFLIVFLKFLFAVLFNWFLSDYLGKISKTKSPLSNVVLLVTCYSEGEDSIRRTLDSLVATDYDDGKKLLFIIADGVVKGSGNEESTPDICKRIFSVAEFSENPEPKSYMAVGDGAKRHNMAQIYAGHYEYAGHRVPVILVAKCGAPNEQGKPKAGNRGKRDSQLILMQFFSRVTFNEKMTPLDFELYHKLECVANLHPLDYDIVCMVDADTLVKRDSLKRMVFAMEKDKSVMGLCGETKIANKNTNWVTRIQVYEYFISHHLGKSFEGKNSKAMLFSSIRRSYLSSWMFLYVPHKSEKRRWDNDSHFSKFG
jgi:chitin synthase